MKKCRTCGEMKETTEFFRDRGFKDGFRGQCKRCFMKCQAASLVRRRARLLQTPLTEKRCCECKLVKPVSAFSKNVSMPDGLNHYCRVCLVKTVMKRTHLPTWWYRRGFGKGKALKMGEVTPQEVQALFNTDPSCFYCRVSLKTDLDNIHVDHKTPRVRGGSDKISNLAIACRACNRMKHDMTELEFRAFLKQYIVRFSEPAPEPIRVYSLAEYAAKAV